MPEIVRNDELHKYWLEFDPIPGVNEILDSQAWSDLSFVPEALLEQKAYEGSLVHRLCEDADKGIDCMGYPHEISGKVSQYEQWKKDNDVQVIESEQIVWSERGFAGTFDKLAFMNGLLYMVDLKTGSKQRVNRLKTAAYKMAYKERTGKEVIRAALYLKTDGYDFDVHINEEDEHTFINCVENFHWKHPRYSKGKKWLVRYQSLVQQSLTES